MSKTHTQRSGFNIFGIRFGRHKTDEVMVPNVQKFSGQQQKVLVIAVIIALLAGVYLIGQYFSVIALSALAAILFKPLYLRIDRKLHRPGTSALLTLLTALVVVIIPLIITVLITVAQVQHLITQLQHVSGGSLSLDKASDQLLKVINKILATITHDTYQITAAQLSGYLAKLASALANFFLHLLTSSFSGLAALVTEFILFIYVFTSMLVHSDKLLQMFRALNPLGDEVSSLYISRTGEMARGSVGGQFIIAVCQGVVEAGILYIAGIHYFFFFALILTILSIIPLGGGIIAIPIGIIELLTGNIWQGTFILLGHFVIITNIDNVLRPRLIPRSVRINSALMMLSVFGGIGLFGFLGIVIGPVIMILTLSTLEIYMPLAEAGKVKQGKRAK